MIADRASFGFLDDADVGEHVTHVEVPVQYQVYVPAWLHSTQANMPSHPVNGSRHIMYPTIVVFLIHRHTQSFLTDAYQSVDGLLGYILETSPEAERAFASDEEVCSLYLGELFANDVLASLREKRPRIVVDEQKGGWENVFGLEPNFIMTNAVGTMPVDDVIRRERVYKITGRALGATPSDNDEMVESPMRNGIGTFRDSKGKDTTLDRPHQHLSDKAQQQGSRKTTAVSCDGKLVAVGVDDATIILWDLATGRVVSRPEGHEDGSMDGHRR
ncbi:hypothetical protein BDY19DRAFT_1060102 [Irpex rosettiformis]|uniref:Uncharacterized protein n=1 Tax=Irpex rosettiformis TaxID=378272 RepID=A0ACB8TRK0_9APHY|nr:hypothetical protein BDY19DRAFT_1060102 [Irpex rosettiformis]